MLPVKGMLLLLAFAVSQVSAYWWSECYAEKEHPYLKMGTKTSYQYVERFGTLYEKVPGCYPVQIWMLIGEGTRYPTDGEIWQMQALRTLRDEIIKNNEAKNSSYLCEADLKNLKRWSLDPMATRENAERLTEKGIEEFKLLAKRVKSNFPELFPPLMSETGSIKYKFRSMDGNKTTESLKAFMSGLFDEVDFPHNDTLFVVNGPCLDTFTNFLSEPSVFRGGPEYQKLISGVSRRLGFLYSNLYSVQIQNMYNMCRYDKAWNIDAISPWCAVFNDEEMKILEYDDDLQEYYNEVDWRTVGCPAMQDLFSTLQASYSERYFQMRQS